MSAGEKNNLSIGYSNRAQAASPTPNGRHAVMINSSRKSEANKLNVSYRQDVAQTG